MGGVDGGNAGRATDSGGITLQDLIPRVHELLTLDWATATDSDAVEAAAVLEAGRVSMETARTLVKNVQAAQDLEEDPDYLARCATRTINALDPDAEEPTEGELIAKEGITFTRPRPPRMRTGMWMMMLRSWIGGAGRRSSSMPCLIAPGSPCGPVNLPATAA